MQITLYRFLIELYFKPPLPVEEYEKLGVRYEGFERHVENMWASSGDVAYRAMKKMVRKKIGRARQRLVSLDIRILREDQYVEICKEIEKGEENHG